MDPTLLPLIGLASSLLVFLLWPFVSHGFRFPVGPDAPVYLWWARLASHDGLSSVGSRPGVPAILLAASGALHISLVAVAAGLEVALSVCVGLGAAAAVRSRFGIADRAGWLLARRDPEADRAEWLLAGALCGSFAVHLAAGYLANLAFAVAFLAAITALARGTRAGAIGAAGLLGAGALAHPQFFALGAVILGLAAMPSLLADWRSRPWTHTEFGRVGVAVVGGAALLGAGFASMLHGVRPPNVETSKDGLLRSLGRAGELRSAYWGRFLDRSARYVQWVSIPLAIAGLPAARGFVGRVLRSWGVMTVVGVAVALATAWFPADRFVTFGYAVPILAALGLVRLARRLGARRGRVLAAAATVVLAGAMLLGAAFSWRRQEPFIAPNEVRTVTAAGRFLSAAPEGSSALFGIGALGRGGLFELARAGNVIRAALPPDRIRAAIPIPTADGSRTDPATVRELAALHDRALAQARARSGDAILNVALRPFAPAWNYQDPRVRVAPGVLMTTASPGSTGVGLPRPAPIAVDPLAPSSAGGIAVASVALLALLGIAGYGWARASIGSGMPSVAIAPAFGLAAITLVAVALDRAGVRLDGFVAPTVAAGLAGAGGYLAWFVIQRRAIAQPAAKVAEQPQQ